MDKLEQIPRIYRAKEPAGNVVYNDEGSSDSSVPQQPIHENAFYEKFALFLKADLGECTEAKPLGGSKVQQKWSTPDVIGYYKVKTTSSFQMHPELVAGELKTDTKYESLITGFGQATSYLLFSHKSYLAIPERSKPDDLDKIETLCITFGIGLLLFNRNDPNNPNFEIRNRARRYEPDIAYLNDLGAKMVDFLEENNEH